MRRFAVILALIVAAGCSVTPHPPVHLTIIGSTSMEPLVRELAEAYTQHHRYVTIDVRGGGSLLGLKAVRDGRADIGMVSRELARDEADELTATPIARDGIAIIVASSNRVTALSLAQVRAVFAGDVLDWRDVGSESGEIQVISREAGSGTRDSFERLAMGEKTVTLAALVMPSGAAIIEYIARYPACIGYASMGELSPNTKALAINGVMPSSDTVRSGKYQLIRPFVLVTKSDADPEVPAFIDFATSADGQAIVAKNYVGVR